MKFAAIVCEVLQEAPADDAQRVEMYGCSPIRRSHRCCAATSWLGSGPSPSSTGARRFETRSNPPVDQTFQPFRFVPGKI